MQLTLSSTLLQEAEQAKSSITTSHGNNINKQPEKGHTRIAFQNARGIEYDLRRPASELIEATTVNNISIYGIAEPNCSFDRELTWSINTALKKARGTGFITHASMHQGK